MNNIPGLDMVLASRKRRMAAFLADHFIMSFLIVMLFFSTLGTDFLDASKIHAVTKMIFILPAFLLYFAKDAVKGISPGKWIFGIMVRDANDPSAVPSFAKLFIRNIFLVIWPVEFLVLAASPDKKRLGDKVAETIVVKNPLTPRKGQRIVALAGVLVVFCLFILLFIATAMKSSGAYKAAIEAIENDPAIREETGGIKGYGMMPAGSIELANGEGYAQFDITVRGNKRNVVVNARLEKRRDGEWYLVEMDSR